MKKMSLRELLCYVDFDYEIIKNNGEDYTDEFERGIDLIRLIDLQDVYLGDIAAGSLTQQPNTVALPLCSAS